LSVAQLTKAVYRRWDATDLDQSFSGGMWSDEAPKGQSLPYVVLEIDTGGIVMQRTTNPDGMAGYRRRIQEAPVVFNVHARTKGTAANLCDKIIKEFNDSSLRMDDDDFGMLSFIYASDYCQKESETVYRWYIEFNARFWAYEKQQS